MSDDDRFFDTKKLRKIVREETGHIAQKYKAIEFNALAADLDEVRRRLAECHVLLLSAQEQIQQALQLTAAAGTSDEDE